MIFYQFAKQLEERTALQTALKHTTEEHQLSDLRSQLHTLQTQLMHQAEHWQSNLQGMEPYVPITENPYLDDGNFVTFR